MLLQPAHRLLHTGVSSIVKIVGEEIYSIYILTQAGAITISGRENLWLGMGFYFSW